MSIEYQFTEKDIVQWKCTYSSARPSPFNSRLPFLSLYLVPLPLHLAGKVGRSDISPAPSYLKWKLWCKRNRTGGICKYFGRACPLLASECSCISSRWFLANRHSNFDWSQACEHWFPWPGKQHSIFCFVLLHRVCWRRDPSAPDPRWDEQNAPPWWSSISCSCFEGRFCTRGICVPCPYRTRSYSNWARPFAPYRPILPWAVFSFRSRPSWRWYILRAESQASSHPPGPDQTWSPAEALTTSNF